MQGTARKAARLFAVAVAVVVVLAAAGVTAVELRWKRRFDAPYPAIAASTDPAVIARGRYLAYGPAACAYCHVPKEEWPRLAAGATPPLSGNHVFRLSLGELFSPNLTPDPETGLGRRTDAEVARTIRYGVRPDGRAAFPLMEFQGLSDADLTAVISFLRSQPAVRLPVPDHRLTLTGKAVMAFAIAPAPPPVPAPGAATTGSSAGPSVAQGEYLANRVALCVTCHTDRNRRDGSFIGPPFSGGQRLDVAADPDHVLVSPNLTPDPGTSAIGVWSEEDFVARFRQGERVAGTIMPWGAYAHMTEDDLRSVYRYLRSLPPVVHATGPVVQPKNP